MTLEPRTASEMTVPRAATATVPRAATATVMMLNQTRFPVLKAETQASAETQTTADLAETQTTADLVARQTSVKTQASAETQATALTNCPLLLLFLLLLANYPTPSQKKRKCPLRRLQLYTVEKNYWIAPSQSPSSYSI